MDLEKYLIDEFNLIAGDIVKGYKAKGMKASGEFEKELKVSYKQNNNSYSVMLTGAKYAEQLQYGRRPSAKAPPMQELFKWIVNKRIMPTTAKEYEIRALAFAIAKKIQREGWDRRDHGGVNLISDVITRERLKKIVETAGTMVLDDMLIQIQTFIKVLRYDNI